MRLIRLQLVLLFIIGVVVSYYYVGGYANQVSRLKTEAHGYVARSSVETFRAAQTGVAYDMNDNVISVMKGEKDVYYLTSDEIPTYVKQAIVSIEDKKFYKHHGVDYRAIVRAVIAMVQNGKVTQGASTITQQLARNIFLTQDRTWERKIEELYIASELEKKYSKDQILEFYLNNIYFANGYYGIQAASRGYFGVDAGQLSLSQIAFLCAIPNNPTNYDPREHFDRTIERRNRILYNMLEDRVISEESYTTAVNDTIYLAESVPVYHNYLETYMFSCATKALMEADGFVFKTEFSTDNEKEAYERSYDEAYAEWNEALFSGGYRIYTSFNSELQQMLQESIDSRLQGYTEVNEEGIYTLQSAAVCIDNTTGYVRAIVGGRSQELIGYTLNRAYQSFRQPGSAIKPLIVYTPSIEDGYKADTIVVDEELEDGPSNADGTYEGEITLRRAVEKSKNTIAYKLFQEVGPERGIGYLQAMNFTHVGKEDMVPAAALGGLNGGVSALEMAAGYATIENDGNYREPTCIVKITNALGEDIYSSERTERVIYSADATRQMTDILEGVLVNGTARGLGLGNMPAAAKTGTTNSNKDGWFAGYTRYYTTAVWVGYDMPKRLPGLSGATYPGAIWQTFMLRAHVGLEPADFIDPVELEQPEGADGLSDEDVGEILNRPGESLQDIMGEGYDENGNSLNEPRYDANGDLITDEPEPREDGEEPFENTENEPEGDMGGNERGE